MLFATVALLAFLSGAAAQCTGNDAPQCPSWKANAGFCTNTGYTMDMRKQYCGVACGFCNRDGTQTAAGGGSTLTECVDKNANCANWVTTQNFCARTDYSNSMKLLYCCKTCRPIIFAPITTTAAAATSDATTGATTSKGTFDFRCLIYSMMLATVILLAFVSGAAAQCTGNDAPQCPSWKANAGFCTNTGYTMDMRKQYCGVACGFCNRDGTQTAAGGGSTLTECVDKNANCANWVTTQNFCARPDYSNAMKLLYCCKTCRPIIFAPTTTTAAAATSDATTGATT
ncbi:hypothetical protein PFISCL1PPCAC_664, partial [Pristionchus fissidentatus]